MLFISASLTGCISSPNDEALLPSAGPMALGIYLIEQNNHTNSMYSIDFDSAELQDNPIIGINDIRMYYQETHKIELEPNAMLRIGRQLTGKPFVLRVGEDRIYGGRFYHMLSSTIYPGVMINLSLMPEEQPYVIIDFLLIDGENDPRSDPRIMDALQLANKLD